MYELICLLHRAYRKHENAIRQDPGGSVFLPVASEVGPRANESWHCYR